MPIYAYRCASCGFAKDHLQKLSDSVLQICPQCGQATYTKQVTAAGFQLKGNGWYATDFKGGNKPPPAADKQDGKASEKATESAASAKSGASTESSASAPSDAAASGGSACAGN